MCRCPSARPPCRETPLFAPHSAPAACLPQRHQPPPRSGPLHLQLPLQAPSLHRHRAGCLCSSCCAQPTPSGRPSPNSRPTAPILNPPLWFMAFSAPCQLSKLIYIYLLPVFPPLDTSAPGEKGWSGLFTPVFPVPKTGYLAERRHSINIP